MPRIIPAALVALLSVSLVACAGPKAFDPVIGAPPDVPGPTGALRLTFSVAADMREFVGLSVGNGVSAYISGHTHNYSAALVDGLLQIDAGHARGTGDTGAMSTFLRFALHDDMAVMTAYRSGDGTAYAPAATLEIAPRSP